MKKKRNEFPILKTLLERSKHGSDLLQILPPEKEEEIKKYHPRSLDIAPLLSFNDWARRIHYSWFLDVLSSIPKQTQSSILSLFSTAQAKALSELLNVPLKRRKISHFSAVFFMHFLKESVLKEDILPETSLPLAEMNALLNLDKKELVHLIDLLGVYDLATDLRQIVDKEMLEKIYGALAPDMLNFLTYCMKQPIKWVSPKLNLQQWDGSKKQLSQILHQRGLIRFSRALAAENKHLQWHLFHRLDIGRVKMMQSNLKQKYEPVQVSYFKNQVLDLAKRYHK